MSSIYLDPTTHVAPKDTGKSIFDQMCDELRKKQQHLVDELTAYRDERFPAKSLEDTQAFEPIKDEIVYELVVDETSVDKIPAALTEKEERRAFRKEERKINKARRKAKRAGRVSRGKDKLKNYLYEHWGIKFETPPNK
jgi:hypothetical protein